ncbi:MAG: alpha/beta fold hydrolase [Bryobacterales bacterium]|nr:alpha/beta fold hydrolase [Bryobacterales bacterium]
MTVFGRREFISLCAAGVASAHQAPTRRVWEQRRPNVLERMQEVMGPLPVMKGSPSIDSGAEFDGGTYVRRHIRYEAEAGDWVPAWLLLPKTRRGRVPAVLCLHQTTRIGKDEPAGLGGKANLHYASELAARGYVTLAPDYPNFGEYSIDVYARGYVSATMKGIVNHMRAVDVLDRLPEVDSRRIGVCGHSLGGHNSLFVAAFDRRIRAVVTSCGFTSFAKYYHGDLTGWSHKGYMPRIASVYGKSPAKMPFDFPDVLSVIAPRPIFINAPTSDSNFDMSGVDDCVNAARKVYEGVYHAGRSIVVEHPESAHDFPPDVRGRAYEFLDARLR